MAAELTFNIVEAHLTGKVDGVHINSRAHSGGRGGSKQAGVQKYFLMDNPFATRAKRNDKDKASIGGTLPMGCYSLRPHESRSNWIRLIPATGTDMKGRDGMAIHGRGKRGSDGCIVPTAFNVVVTLYDLAKARQRDGRPEITLQVVATGFDVDRKLRQMREIA
jgi:hypothetical protein